MARLTKASYIKIVLIIVGSVLVLGALAYGATTYSTGYMRFATGTGDAEMGSANINAKDVRNITINWAAGSVNVVVIDDATSTDIQVVETAARGTNPPRPMEWKMSGDNLQVSYGPMAWLEGILHGYKNLEVRIPRAYADKLGTVEVTGASGTYRISDIGCETLRLNLASGSVDAVNVRATDLATDVASGRVDISGTFDGHLDLSAASGHVNVVCKDSSPRSADIDVTSGTTTLALPQTCGFTASIDKVSGSFSSEFATTQQGDSVRYGDGSMPLKVSLVSGQCVVKQAI